MQKIEEWKKQHPKGQKFQCNCGATVYLNVESDERITTFSTRCWKCGKALELHEHSMLIQFANFDLITKLIDRFIGIFNRNEKAVHVIK